MEIKKKNGNYGLFFNEDIDLIKPTKDLDISRKDFVKPKPIGWDERGLPTYQKPRTIRIVYRQTGKVDKSRKRNALPPGERISRTGKRYTETRANRSSLDFVDSVTSSRE